MYETRPYTAVWSLRASGAVRNRVVSRRVVTSRRLSFSSSFSLSFSLFRFPDCARERSRRGVSLPRLEASSHCAGSPHPKDHILFCLPLKVTMMTIPFTSSLKCLRTYGRTYVRPHGVTWAPKKQPRANLARTPPSRPCKGCFFPERAFARTWRIASDEYLRGIRPKRPDAVIIGCRDCDEVLS